MPRVRVRRGDDGHHGATKHLNVALSDRARKNKLIKALGPSAPVGFCTAAQKKKALLPLPGLGFLPTGLGCRYQRKHYLAADEPGAAIRIV